MIGHTIVLFGSSYTLLSGLVKIPKVVVYLFSSLGALLTIAPCLASLYLFLKELKQTKHGRWRFILHTYLKSSFNDYGHKKILSLLPKCCSYCDFFSNLLATGSLNLFVFGRQTEFNRVIVQVHRNKPVHRVFVLASIFILKVKICVKNRSVTKIDWRCEISKETGATIRDVEVRIYMRDNGLKVTFKNLITGESWEDFVNQKGNFSPTPTRMFEYARELIWSSKAENRYLVTSNPFDDRNLSSINYKVLLKYILCQQSYIKVDHWKCTIGGSCKL